MGVTRRQFLQQVGGTLAAWGVSETGVWALGDRYWQAVAAPTSRKFALLMGINQYPFGSLLEGCVTDVELQRELLIHQFGFDSADIVSLTDEQATRAAITAAFIDYLIPTVKAGDVVVVHFSGFGSGVAGASGQPLRPSLVLADEVPMGEVPVVNDLLLETLGLLLRSLKTDRITTILDTSYVYPGQPLQGNLRVRAYPNPSTAQPAAAELELQAMLLSQLKLNRDRQPDLANLKTFPGVVLAAAGVTQVATEVRWNHLMNAGLFTQTLTQTLWQASPATSIALTLNRVTPQVAAIASQQHPTLQGQAIAKQPDKLPPYFVPGGTLAAVGAIVAVEANGNSATLWLGGLPAALLEHYGVNSLVTISPTPDGQAAPTLQITAREGFTARAKVCCQSDLAGADVAPLQVGQRVQEAVRVLPRNIGLTVALDGSLERIERVDAISAFTAVPRVSLAIAGEQPADLLFSKVQTPPTQLAALPSMPLSLAATPATLSYGLFSPGRDVILSTTGEGGEAVKVAVKRLVPKLQTLLATKLLNLTVNDQTSHLAVTAQLEQLTPQAQMLAAQGTGTMRGLSAVGKLAIKPTADLVQIPLGSRIRFRLENQGTLPLYSLAIALDTASNLQWLHLPLAAPAPTLPPETAAVTATLLPQTTTTLPTAIAGSEWQLQGTAGIAETYLMLSTEPFTQTLATLTAQQRAGNSAIAGAIIANPLEVVQAILQDLHQPTFTPVAGNPPDVYTLHVSTWATLRFTYQIS